MTKTIMVSNQKGGVGKTTTTLELGAIYARKGKRVLVIDRKSTRLNSSHAL